MDRLGEIARGRPGHERQDSFPDLSNIQADTLSPDVDSLRRQVPPPSVTHPNPTSPPTSSAAPPSDADYDDDDDNDLPDAFVVLPQYKDTSHFYSDLRSRGTDESEAPLLVNDEGEIEFRSKEGLVSQYQASIYEDFDTIDWIRDSISDRIKRAQVDAKSAKTAESPLDKVIKVFRKVYRQFYRSQGWLLVTVMAIIVGFLAGAIDVAVDFLADTRFGYCRQGVFLSRKLCCEETESECAMWLSWGEAAGIDSAWGLYFFDYAVYVSLAAVFAGLAAWYVKALARWATGSGIPEVKTILGGFVILKFSSWQTLLVKVPGLVLSVSSGLNLGKEGPLVHVACCVCNCVSYMFPKYKGNQAKLREMLSAAAAAGVSVAFGAPIGGVLFSLEEVSYYFPHKTMWRAFFCASVAALVLQAMNPFHNGKLIIFQVDYNHNWMAFEFIPFIIIGVLGGLLGGIFIRMNVNVCRFRRANISQWSITEAIVIAMLTAFVSYSNDYLRNNASEVISELYAECTPGSSTPLCNPDTAPTEIIILLFASCIRLLLTIFTFGVKVPAGLFIPTLAVGASVGHSVGLIMSYWQSNFPDFFLFNECTSVNCIDPGVYSLIGSAAMLSGVTRMTVSLVVIMFEITGDVQYIVPIMIVVMVSKWVGDGIAHDGIYDEHILLNEYPFLDNKASYRFSQVAKSIMKPNLFVLELRPYSVNELRTHIENNVYTGWPIVTKRSEMYLVGYIARSELRQALDIATKNALVNGDTLCYFSTHVENDTHPYVDLRPWMDSTPTQVTPRTPLNIIFEMFKKMGMRYVLVSYRGRLVGIITKKDMLQHIAVHFHGKFRTFVVSERSDQEKAEKEDEAEEGEDGESSALIDPYELN